MRWRILIPHWHLHRIEWEFPNILCRGSEDKEESFPIGRNGVGARAGSIFLAP